MNVGNIGATTYNAWTTGVNEAKSRMHAQNNKSFSNVARNQGAAANLTLHGVDEELKEKGYTSVGSWADAATGTSAAVYKPKNFDESNPVYLMRTWDAAGNMTEKEVKLDEVNPKSANVYDMYAYSCYLSDSGKYPDATRRFIGSIPNADMAKFGCSAKDFGLRSFEDAFSGSVNWLNVVKGWMDMQFGAGNMKGFLDYKKFYDALGGV